MRIARVFRRRRRPTNGEELIAVLDRFTTRPIRIHHHVTREPEPEPREMTITFNQGGLERGRFTVDLGSAEHLFTLRPGENEISAYPMTVVVRVSAR